MKKVHQMTVDRQILPMFRQARVNDLSGWTLSLFAPFCAMPRE
jgi:hypothetical protein